MALVALVLALIVGVTVVSALSRRFGLPTPIVLVVAGLLASLVPGVPGYRLDPELVLVGFLPPLLYAESLGTSLRDLRANRRNIALLSVGLVLASTLVVGYVAHLLIPDLPLATGFVLGAIVAPPDALAAAGIVRRVGLPRKVVAILEGESLLNDATALVAYRIAVAAVVTGAFSFGEAVLEFVLVSIVGTAVGLGLGYLVVEIRRHIDDPLTENTVSLVTPFAAYLLAEELHGSGVLAVVLAGLVAARKAPLIVSSTTRLQGQAVWVMIAFLLRGIVFALIGLQLPQILDGLHGYSFGQLSLYAAGITLTAVLVRIVWMFPPRICRGRCSAGSARAIPTRRGRHRRSSPGRDSVVSSRWPRRSPYRSRCRDAT